MAAFNRPRKQSHSKLCTLLFFTVLFTIPALFLLHTSSSSFCNSINATASLASGWSGDLRDALFAWNRLSFVHDRPPPAKLKIAVFSRKWPIGSIPGGMERHAHTLHTALARRGHRIHVFTSPASIQQDNATVVVGGAKIHCHKGEPGRWRYNKAWELYEEENTREPFDVVHSESVALPYWRARDLGNLAVSWHGIALESLQSRIYQDLARNPGEQRSPDFNQSLYGILPKILDEIRFFHSYAHHVAISDSCGEMLRDVYQIPEKRVHVILNGVDEKDFEVEANSGAAFRSRINLNGSTSSETLIFGVAGRLVKDKGHPLLYEAFSRLAARHPHVYLVVAGSGPWEQRYRELGPQVVVLGSMSPTELKSFYNGIDLFVNPTLRPQGLDLTLMEAMMSAKAVMASRFPSIKGSVVVEDEFGFMFSPNAEALTEAMERAVAEGRDRLAQRGKACRNYAAKMFGATQMALAYERLYLCIKNQSFCKYP